MSQLIDKTNFSDLTSCDPDEVVQRTGCEYDETKKQYLIKIWGQRYCVDLSKCEVTPVDAAVKTHRDFLYLFILYYLMKSRDVEPSGTWVSEKDIPGGAAFFRGPHTIPTDVIAEKYGNDIDKFKEKCTALNGSALPMADAAFVFTITPTIPIAALYWQGDEDFPCEAKLLFDKTIEQHLPLDILFAIASEVCHVIGK